MTSLQSTHGNKGFAPETPENDENRETGKHHSGKSMHGSPKNIFCVSLSGGGGGGGVSHPVSGSCVSFEFFLQPIFVTLLPSHRDPPAHPTGP